MPEANKAEKLTQNDILPKNWQRSEDYFTSNDLINAYLDGKEAGKKEEKQKWINEFTVNVKLATSISEELYALGEESKIKFSAIHLKARSLKSFESLFFVDKKLFLSENFRNIYTLSRNLRNKYMTDKFNLSFSFTPETDEVSIDSLAADGFLMHYEKAKKA